MTAPVLADGNIAPPNAGPLADNQRGPATSPAAMVQPAAVSGSHSGDGAENADGGTVVLLRTCVAEATWSLSDCAAILHVLQTRADRAGVSMPAMAQRYSSAFRGQQSPRIRWVMQLDATCAEPHGFTSTLRWATWADHCRRVVGAVRAFQRGELANPCPGARHWGGSKLQSDRDRMVRAVQAGKWRVVKCNLTTANTYFAEVR